MCVCVCVCVCLFVSVLLCVPALLCVIVHNPHLDWGKKTQIGETKHRGVIDELNPFSCFSSRSRHLTAAYGEKRESRCRNSMYFKSKDLRLSRLHALRSLDCCEWWGCQVCSWDLMRWCELEIMSCSASPASPPRSVEGWSSSSLLCYWTLVV